MTKPIPDNRSPISPFGHIALIGRAGKESADTLEAVKQYLTDKKLSVYIEQNTADMMQNNHLPTFPENNIPREVDLMIVVGGDGSLLHAAHCALPNNIPVLGINRGKLGFLTDIHPQGLSKMDDILSGKYHAEKRFLLKASYENHTDVALNDVVLLPSEAQLIEFDILINDQFVCHQRADGLIIATPTGSTAYALSAGGPILHPHLNAVVLVPMFPHTLSSRPIAIDANAKIELLISQNNTASPCISCDGQERFPVKPGTRITVTQHSQTLQLIHPNSYDYFSTLREKLGWQANGDRGSRIKDQG